MGPLFLIGSRASGIFTFARVVSRTLGERTEPVPEHVCTVFVHGVESCGITVEFGSAVELESVLFPVGVDDRFSSIFVARDAFEDAFSLVEFALGGKLVF